MVRWLPKGSTQGEKDTVSADIVQGSNTARFATLVSSRSELTIIRRRFENGHLTQEAHPVLIFFDPGICRFRLRTTVQQKGLRCEFQLQGHGNTGSTGFALPEGPVSSRLITIDGGDLAQPTPVAIFGVFSAEDVNNKKDFDLAAELAEQETAIVIYLKMTKELK